MKKSILIALSFFFVIVFAGAFYIVSRSNSGEAKSAAEKEPERMCCAGDMHMPDKTGMAEMSDNSVYLLDQDWKSEKNLAVKWSSLKGTPRVMAMIFTNCTYACPVIVNDMKKVEAGLSDAELSKIKFLLVSIDPDRDSPAAMRKFAEDQKLDLNRWQLLTSTYDNVGELAAVMNFKYKREKDGSFSHSNIISVLNNDGEIAYQHFGLNNDISDVIQAVRKLNQPAMQLN